MAGRGEGWLFVAQPDGTCSVYLDGRVCVHDRYDLDEAVRWARRDSRRWAGQPMTLELPDGTRERLEVPNR